MDGKIEWRKIFNELETSSNSLKSIAAKYGISLSKLRYHGTKHGVLPRQKRDGLHKDAEVEQLEGAQLDIAGQLKKLILMQLKSFERQMSQMTDEDMPSEQDVRLTASLVRSLEKVAAIENAQLKQKDDPSAPAALDELQKDILARLSRLK